jgi:hypothetical protein
LALFFDINALVTAVMIIAFFVHEATALSDVGYATATRVVAPVEQHVHSFLEMILSPQSYASYRFIGTVRRAFLPRRRAGAIRADAEAEVIADRLHRLDSDRHSPFRAIALSGGTRPRLKGQFRSSLPST